MNRLNGRGKAGRTTLTQHSSIEPVVDIGSMTALEASFLPGDEYYNYLIEQNRQLMEKNKTAQKVVAKPRAKNPYLRFR